MSHHFIKLALRHFAKQKLHVSLNVVGLVMGVVCMLFAVLYWLDERSFDSFHAKSDQLYRITTTMTGSAGESPKTLGGTGQVQGPAFKAAVPEVLDYVRILGGDIYGEMRHEHTTLKLQLLFADSSFFHMFSFPLLQGDSATALRELNSVVLTERTALRFFNSTEAIGKLLYLDADPSAEKLGSKPVVVAGIVKDPPANSSIQFDVLHPFKFMQLSHEDFNWLNAYLGTYVLLPQNPDLQAIAQKFNQIYAEKSTAQIEAAGFDPNISYRLQPLTDIHLNSLLGDSSWHEGGTVGESKPVYSNLFLGIAFFIFLLACINFVNISIAGSLGRAKEVSVRKINGSGRASVVLQFLGEATLICGFAFVVALLAAELLLPDFNQIANKKISLQTALNRQLLTGFSLVFLVNILLSGLYPAILLSAFKPVEVLYNRSNPIGQLRLGKALVVLQFSLAFLLAAATLVFYQQMDFVKGKELGYDPSLVVRTQISGDRDYEPIKQVLKNGVESNPNFEDIAYGGVFGNDLMETSINGQKTPAVYQSVDTSYLSVMGIELRQGRNFSAINKPEVVVNEAFVRAAGLKSPIGATVQLHPDYTNGQQAYTIVGVAADFHFESLHMPIQPLALLHVARHSGDIWLKIRPEKSQEALRDFERLYQKAIPGATFEYHFLTDLNARLYDREARWQKIIGIAAGLAMVICCLGLFGMAHLSAQQRMREIGVRKVLGATTAGIVALLSNDFLKLVVIAVLVASPVAYFFIQKWLENFAYRIEIQWTVFALAGLAAVTVAFLTVSFQSIKAALANPVKSLRSE